MAEPKSQTPASPRTPTPGGGGDASAIWLHGALHGLFGAVAAEPVPEALRRLAAGEARGPPVGRRQRGRPPPARSDA
jgi:hypothetical protein